MLFFWHVIFHPTSVNSFFLEDGLKKNDVMTLFYLHRLKIKLLTSGYVMVRFDYHKQCGDDTTKL